MANEVVQVDVRVLGAKLLAQRLEALIVANRRGVGLDMNQIAADLLTRAADLAPILTGDLIRTGRVLRRGSEARGVITRVVSFGTNHAVWTHEASYNLGPISRQKPPTEDGPVGRKYLERPFRAHADRYMRFLRDELDKRNRRVVRRGQ